MATLTAVGAFIRIPVPYVPITLQVTFVCLAGLWLGPRRAAASQVVYVTAGLVGLSAQAEDPMIARRSGRGREGLRHVAKGLTNKEIAQELVISPATARNHVSHVLEKLEMRSRSELAAFAAKVGLGEPHEA